VDDATSPDARSTRLAEVADRIRRETPATTPETTRSRIGELSKDHIKILANKRTNALVLMASKSDITTLTEIINSMDIMLSQVLIETVILEVSLDDSLETGIDWVQRAMAVYSTGQRTPQAAFATRGGGGMLRPVDPINRRTIESFGDATSGLTSYLTFFGLNVDAVIRASASDTRSRIISSPVILTQDNKPASIEATTTQYFLEGTTQRETATGNVIRDSNVKPKNVGIVLKVEPRINARGFVVMKIEQSIENISGTQQIDDGTWPIITTRKLQADVSVTSGETVVLGGLVMNNQRNVKGGIPLLKDIPVLGWLFRRTSMQEGRSEVVVFLTPYVLDTPEQVERETRRRRDALNIGGMWQQGWSGSDMAGPPTTEQPAFPRPRARPSPAASAARPTTDSQPAARVAPAPNRTAPTPGPAQDNPMPSEEVFQGLDNMIREHQRQWDDAMRDMR
jgi:general secretion pathway protein D